MVWVQVIIFIISNAPALIKAIRELMKAFKGDKEVGAAVLAELKEAKRKQQTAEAAAKKYADIIEGYKSSCPK